MHTCTHNECSDVCFGLTICLSPRVCQRCTRRIGCARRKRTGPLPTKVYGVQNFERVGATERGVVFDHSTRINASIASEIAACVSVCSQACAHGKMCKFTWLLHVFLISSLPFLSLSFLLHLFPLTSSPSTIFSNATPAKAIISSPC